MNRTQGRVIPIVVISLFLAFPAFAANDKQPPTGTADAKGEQPAAFITLKVPVASPLFSHAPVAIVNGEEITLQDLNGALTSSHEGMVEDKKQAARIDYAQILKRMINTRLIVQEARNIGLDELPETKEAVAAYARTTLKELFREDITRDVKPDEKEVEKLYREVIKEWKIKSLLFRKEDDAKKAAGEIQGGKKFDEIAAQAIKDGTAQGGGEGTFQKPKDLQPQIADAVLKMKTGSLSQVIRIETGKKDSGFVILTVEDVRFPDDAVSKDRARQAVLAAKKDEVVKAYRRSLYKKQVTLNKKLIASLDYESSKPGFPALLKDKRVIAEIKGERPVTVRELSGHLQGKFYHGMESAAEAKKINTKKIEALEEIVDKKLVTREALKRGIEKTDNYKTRVKDYEQSLLFGTFIQKVVAVDVKVKEEELKAYYDEHRSEYTYPEMMRVSSIVFGNKDDAASALDKLRKGADFNWMKTNAEGQVDKNTQGLLPFEGVIVTVKDFPEDVRRTISGARPGDFRLYASPGDHYYVLSIQDVIPPQLQAFDEVKGPAAKKVYNIKLTKAVEDWADRLRAVAEVTVYLPDSGK